MNRDINTTTFVLFTTFIGILLLSSCTRSITKYIPKELNTEAELVLIKQESGDEQSITMSIDGERMSSTFWSCCQHTYVKPGVHQVAWIAEVREEVYLSAGEHVHWVYVRDKPGPQSGIVTSSGYASRPTRKVFTF